jgi:Matrixin
MDRWVEVAFHAWAIYSGLKFKRVYDTSADIIIGFGVRVHGDPYPFDGPGNILAHAFYPYEENNFGGKEISGSNRPEFQSKLCFQATSILTTTRIGKKMRQL